MTRQVEIGCWTVFVLTDCAPNPAPCSYAFPDADLSTHPDAASRWLSENLFRTRFGVCLLRGPAGDMLVDCGVGPGPTAYFPGLTGRLIDSLAAAGSAPERVADVVFTHLHVDHVGWSGAFPQARFHVAEAEWTHWSVAGVQAGLPHHVAAFERCIAPLAASGRLHVFGDDAGGLPDGVRPLPAPGHTPGHHAVLVQGRLLIAGDLWHNPAQIEVPRWCHRADQDKPRAIASRTAFAAQAEREGWLVAAGHFTEDVSLGRIEAGRFVPLSPSGASS